MDEVLELCRRMLGPGAAADEAAEQVRNEAAAGGDRIALLTAAARACRSRTSSGQGVSAPDGGGADAGVDAGADASAESLAAAVARELAAATAALPERQREALALREMLRLSYEQIGTVMEIDAAAVAPLLARARLRLRAERRGGEVVAGPDCQDRDRALRLLAARQDSEPMSGEDDEWLLAHLAGCASCDMAHAAMLEASVCYRAWPHEQPAAT
jgi:DNA-directed RNA polymerase specialized sigma24 family protein